MSEIERIKKDFQNMQRKTHYQVKKSNTKNLPDTKNIVRDFTVKDNFTIGRDALFPRFY